jgi:hypothetical protein
LKEKTLGYMTLAVELENGGLVELTGSTAKYWKAQGLPDYEGAIEGLPQGIIDELVALGALRVTA